MKPLQKILIIGSMVPLVLLMAVSCSQSDSFYSNNLRTDLFTQQYTVNSYDFLWVLDNSPSMDAKRQYLADNIQTFLNTLNSNKAINYQMAITNVDFFSNPGGLIANPSGLNVVKSATSANPASDFASIVNSVVDTGTSFWEQGLIQSVLTINNNGPLFFRSGVPKVIIYLTDDDDWSCAGMLNGTSSCYGVQPENNPDIQMYDTGYFINYFKNIESSQGVTVTLFPIVGQSNASCIVERVGMRYMNVATAIGGDTVSGGLCPDTIGNSLNAVASTIANRGVVFALSQPATASSITVYVNGQLVPNSSTDGYTFDPTGNAIIFNGDAIPSNGQTISVIYTLLTD